MECTDGAAATGEPRILSQSGREQRLADARTADGYVQVLLTRELNSALTAIKARTQLLRRRLARSMRRSP
jgi:hypothetical protein